MKLLSSLVFTVAALATGAATAAQYSSDQERRDQNRAEALANWHAANDGKMSERSDRDATDRSASRRSSLRERTHEGAQSVRGFTHRQAEKARNFSERQDRRYGTKRTTINTSPEGGGK